MSTARDIHIGFAVYRLKQGNRVRRRAWLGRYWIELQEIRIGGVTRSLILVNGRDETYSATQADLLADDWEVMPFDHVFNHGHKAKAAELRKVLGA
jgi:hypothetical protein